EAGEGGSPPIGPAGLAQFRKNAADESDVLSKLVMPGLVPGIHALASLKQRKTWMAGTKPGHDETANPSLRGARFRRGGRVTFDLGKQPHRKNHEASEKGDDVLDASVAEIMLMEDGEGRYQNDQQRQAELDLDRHRSTSRRSR